MKLKDLWKIILQVQKEKIYDWENLDVVIPVDESSIGAMASIYVKYANSGFDWDAGNFHIIGSEPLIRKPKNHKDQKEEIQERIYKAKLKEEQYIYDRIRKWDGETRTELGRILRNLLNNQPTY